MMLSSDIDGKLSARPSGIGRYEKKTIVTRERMRTRLVATSAPDASHGVSLLTSNCLRLSESGLETETRRAKSPSPIVAEDLLRVAV